jgi:hypothetical protein
VILIGHAVLNGDPATFAVTETYAFDGKTKHFLSLLGCVSLKMLEVWMTYARGPRRESGYAPLTVRWSKPARRNAGASRVAYLYA